MVDRFYNIINGDALANVNGIGLENQSRLFFAKFTSLDVVGIVSHTHLQFMIQTSGHTDAFFIAQRLQQGVIGNGLTEFSGGAAEKRCYFF